MWLFENKEFNLENYPDYFGFVYEIENLKSGRKYIGKKLFTKAGYKTVKGKRKKIRKESDWLSYYGSSPELQKDVESLGTENFKRTILRLCKTRGEASYYEAKYQFEVDAILRDDYYNGWMSVRVSSSHVKHLLVEGAP